MKKILFTICGRGGSKGVQGKNIRPFLGVPLIALTLYDTMRAFEDRSDVAKVIAIDSDSEEILSTARRILPGALFHLRESGLAGDATPKLAAIGSLLDHVEEQSGCVFDTVLDLDITSPIRSAHDVEQVCSILDASGRDVVFSVVSARRNPYFNMVEKGSDGTIALCKGGHFTSRQQAPPVYEMNASIYAYRREAFRGKPLSPLDLPCDIYEMEDPGVLDIDSEGDWILMETVYSSNCAKNPEGYLKRKLDHYRPLFL